MNKNKLILSPDLIEYFNKKHIDNKCPKCGSESMLVSTMIVDGNDQIPVIMKLMVENNSLKPLVNTLNYYIRHCDECHYVEFFIAPFIDNDIKKEV